MSSHDLVNFTFGSKAIRVMDQNGDPWFVLRDLLDAMGSATKVTDAVESIKQGLGDEFASDVPILDSLGRKQNSIIVSESAATYLLSRSNTEKGRELNRFIHVEVLPSIRKTGKYEVVPHDYISALKALVASEEAKLLLAQKAAYLEHEKATLETQLEADRPYTEIAKAMTGETTMIVRDWIALMKKEHGNHIKERKVRQFLHDSGYWYWTQTAARVTRAYAKFDHLFKLETTLTNNGIYIDVLKITGQGVYELTPVVVAHFHR